MRLRSPNFIAAATVACAIALPVPAIGQEKSVKPGINRQFENPSPSEFSERFEHEGREVFDARTEIVQVCKVTPGMAIADIGAGTGLFTRMFAPLVRTSGRVYAVDIAPNFVEHIVQSCKSQGLNNVTGIVCKQDSVELPDNSIDLAFICDTYHHFEFPEKTMRSLHRALRPNGQLIVVEFDRIEGVSSAWILDHVRAGKQTFADEIVQTGFRLRDDVELLKESYILRFEKLPDGTAPEKTATLETNPLHGKRLIEWGWDEPDTKFMRENIEQMEKMPFDGLVFHANSKSGANLTWEMWGKRQFARDEFDDAVEDLRTTRFRRLSDRFLRVNVTPGEVDWFDDEAWATVQNNFAVAASVARDGHTKGFMFDVEQYNSHLFDYGQQKSLDSKQFADYQSQVRERGRQWIQAINQAFPDITILLTFGYSIAQPKASNRDRSESRYGLLADFLDGMLDSCSDRTLIVDAWETSYPYKRADQFSAAYGTIRDKSAQWSADSARYHKFVRAGFGIWMDHDWRRAGWDLSDFSKNHFTPAEFESAVRSALHTSDSYVWIYTEQPRWWTNEKLPPEYVEALKQVRGR